MHDVDRNSIFHKDWEKKGHQHGTRPHGVHEDHHHCHDDHDHHHHDHHHEHHHDWLDKLMSSSGPDWFAVFVMSIFIIAGHFRWLPGTLSDGVVVGAAMIGLYPPLKNSIFTCLHVRRPSAELVVCLVLLVMLFCGMSLEVALCTLTLMLGSFLHFHFSWRG